MKKYFIAVLLVLFATSVYAEVNFELSGTFHGRGQYWSHEAYTASPVPGLTINRGFGQPIPNGINSDTVTWSVYDGDLNLYPKIIVDNTSLTMKLAIKDETWDDPDGDRIVETDEDGNFVRAYDGDDNIKVERLYVTHAFANGVFLDVGLMDGAAWGTTFADTVVAKYRVKVIHSKTPVGAIGALVEKNAESSSPYIKDSEKEDDDSYALFMVTKAGDIFIKPLIFYVVQSSKVPGVDALGVDEEDALKVLYLACEFSGDLGGGIGFESEIGWKQYDVEDLKGLAPVNPAVANAKDADTYGVYLNIWKNLDALKLGAVLTYGSYDDKGGPTGTGIGWDYGDDFESNLLLGDWIAWGDNESDPNKLERDLIGMNMVKLYADSIKTPIDKLTFKGSLAYVWSNQKDTALFQATFGAPNIYDGASAWEIDLGGEYAFTDNCSYRFQAGYADFSYDTAGYSDPDPVMLLEHRVQFTF